MIRYIDRYVSDPRFPSWLPRSLSRILMRSERYRFWARRLPTEIADDPSGAKCPIYPKWSLSASVGGWETRYTRIADRFFRLSIYRETHLVPPYHVDLEEWREDAYGGLAPFTPSGTAARHWGTLRESYYSTLEAAEAEYARLASGMEELLMEQTL